MIIWPTRLADENDERADDPIMDDETPIPMPPTPVPLAAQANSSRAGKVDMGTLMYCQFMCGPPMPR